MSGGLQGTGGLVKYSSGGRGVGLAVLDALYGYSYFEGGGLGSV